jgi:hypothetical protein
MNTARAAFLFALDASIAATEKQVFRQQNVDAALRVLHQADALRALRALALEGTAP